MTPSPSNRLWFPLESTERGQDHNSTLDPAELDSDSSGVYETPDSSLRAFVTDLPKTPTHSRTKTQVDLVLPPLLAFNAPCPCEISSFRFAL